MSDSNRAAGTAAANGAGGGTGPIDLGQPVPQPPWAESRNRRPRRAARPPLGRDQIVEAALAIVDSEGVDALSLRRLADRLRVTPMSIYWHVRDKAELLDLVGQAVFLEMEVPPARGDWRRQLRDVHVAMFAGFQRHPNTGEILVGRARYGSGGITLFERILTILRGAGFAPDAAWDAYHELYLFTLGSMTSASRSHEFRETQRQGLMYMLSLPEDRFPSIRAVAPVIGRRTVEEQFELELDVTIAGIEARLAPPAARRERDEVPRPA